MISMLNFFIFLFYVLSAIAIWRLMSSYKKNYTLQIFVWIFWILEKGLRKTKLWTHLFVMSDFMLDVESPYDIPKPEALNENPAIMDYPSSSIKYGHYGKYTQAILEASRETTDQKKKEYLKTSMANFMKKQYHSHNNDAVENNVIAENLKELSKGDLILENPDDLVNTSTILREMGLNKKFTKPNNNFKQKKKFKKQTLLSQCYLLTCILK